MESKDMIKSSLQEIAISARSGIENGEFSKKEVGDYIREYGNKELNKVIEMPDASFCMYVIARLADMHSELMERR